MFEVKYRNRSTNENWKTIEKGAQPWAEIQELATRDQAIAWVVERARTRETNNYQLFQNGQLIWEGNRAGATVVPIAARQRRFKR